MFALLVTISFVITAIVFGATMYLTRVSKAGMPVVPRDNKPDTSPVKAWTPQEVLNYRQNQRISEGLKRLHAHILAAKDEEENQPEDAYSKKLRLNAEHEAELAARRPLTAEQREAHANAASKHYWANREAILQRKKQQRVDAAIAAGRKPRVHATYIKQDDNPHPVHSAEYQRFAAEKRQKFHEQKHAVVALTTGKPVAIPAPDPAPALTYSREPVYHIYGQRALA
jgi:hypothetical protein